MRSNWLNSKVHVDKRKNEAFEILDQVKKNVEAFRVFSFLHFSR